MDSKRHWESVYSNTATDGVSWFQPQALQSLSIIKSLSVSKTDHIIDVGGGHSTLVDDLLQLGYKKLSVLDISQAALNTTKARLGERAEEVKWIVKDITSLTLPPHSIDIWHDRAVFHFLTRKEDRDRYIQTVLKAVKPGGFVIIATFAKDGPEECSGLLVRRYSASELQTEFGSAFTLLGHEQELHETPFATFQKFIYCYWRVRI